MFGVDEPGDPPLPLGLGDDVERQGGLPGGFRAEDLGHPPPGDPADSERHVERQRARRDDRNIPRSYNFV